LIRTSAIPCDVCSSHGGISTGDSRPDGTYFLQRPRSAIDWPGDFIGSTYQLCRAGLMSTSEVSVDGLAERIVSLEPQVRPHIDTTPVVALPVEGSGVVLMKCEHQQRTGSFKVRGAVAKLLTLTGPQRDRGVVAASSGNHGLGVAYALSRIGGTGLICVPEHASPVKIAAIEALGVTVRRVGSETGESEIWARAHADETGMTYISPYNDLDVICGQGTLGLELDRQLGPDPIDVIVVAVGGGGLVSGVAAAIKARRPYTRIVGASPANDPAMLAAVRAGRVVGVDAQPTLSDGTAGAVEPGSITVPLCAALVDEWILVEEEQIRDALAAVIDRTHQLVEGAAAVAISAALSIAAGATSRQRIAVISCGANISAATLAAALHR
jgi:threonine dehydratase